MGILHAVRSFARDTSGVVTVDWVVLSAALVGMSLAAASVVRSGLEDLTAEIADQLQRDHIGLEAD